MRTDPTSRPSTDSGRTGPPSAPLLVPSAEHDVIAGVVASVHRGACAGHRAEVPDRELRQGICVAVCTYKRPASLVRFFDSLASQSRIVDQVVIVDASPDDASERAMAGHPVADGRIPCLLYFRVAGALKGLTRQRNFALRWVTADKVAFFDDDVVLLPGCMKELEKPFLGSDDRIAGVACYIADDLQRPSLLWRLRRMLGVVSTLTPGRYCRSGVSIPWGFLGERSGFFEGDWLPGCAMMWRTAEARAVRFNEAFSGYSHGEDLEFSLRMRAKGRLGVSGEARALHLHDTGGRPSAYEMGFMTARNAYDIHRRLLPDRTKKDAALFVYAFGVDAILRSLKLVWPIGFRRRLEFVRGRSAFLLRLLRTSVLPRRSDGTGSAE